MEELPFSCPCDLYHYLHVAAICKYILQLVSTIFILYKLYVLYACIQNVDVGADL